MMLGEATKPGTSVLNTRHELGEKPRRARAESYMCSCSCPLCSLRSDSASPETLHGLMACSLTEVRSNAVTRWCFQNCVTLHTTGNEGLHKRARAT